MMRDTIPGDYLIDATTPQWVRDMHAAPLPERAHDRVRPGLWVGGIWWGPPTPGEFDHVWTVCPSYGDDQRVPAGMWHHRRPLRDRSDLPLDDALLAAMVAKIARQVRAGEKVLVRCVLGVNRAPFVAALALAEIDGMSGQEALQAVRAARGPSVLCNPAFAEFLAVIPRRRAVRP
jgi:hypothetical protein